MYAEEEFAKEFYNIFHNENIIFSKNIVNIENYTSFIFNEKYSYIPNTCVDQFKIEFSYCLKNNTITFDNLINILVMVKNGGDVFKRMLKHNLQYADYITILDTGSTDDTVKNVKKFLENNKGVLYEREWKNFRDSRNELLDLAGDKYVFNIMLDDSYFLHGDVRNYLKTLKTHEADSFSIFIKDDFSLYSSNRIFRNKKIRYKYTIHEIPEKNKNYEISSDIMYITDEIDSTMVNRTKDRKKSDLDLLLQQHTDDPDDTRLLYYIAETYLNMEEFENAFKYYKLRSDNNGGNIPEIHDSLYKMAVISYFNLEKDWDICMEQFLNCFESDKTRPEPLYIIGYHYVNSGNNDLAYKYLIDAYNIAKNFEITSMNCRYKIAKYEIPKNLLELCHINKNYDVGFQCACDCVDYEQKNGITNTQSDKWKSVFYMCTQSVLSTQKSYYKNAKTICVIAPGGWDQWDGTTLETTGLGGSETCIIKYAEQMAEILSSYNIVIFCNCKTEMVYKKVFYIPLNNIYNFVSTYKIDHCLINRHEEYALFCEYNSIPNIYIIFHDTFTNCELMSTSDSIKKIFCLTQWHKELFLEQLPQFRHKTTTLQYGIETSAFKNNQIIPYSFIYPSFPNRGLLPLLEIFPHIKERYPQAILNIFCDMDHKWCYKYYKDDMDNIKKLIDQPGVINHGWVKKEELEKYWSTSHVWLYPCTFKETFCRVALEAAASKTVAIVSDLAALNETVGDRGIIIPGDPKSIEWKTEALKNVFNIFDNPGSEMCLVKKNFEWAEKNNYKNVVDNFIREMEIGTFDLLNTCGMLNWSHNIPNKKETEIMHIIFGMISQVESPHILEIGTFTGVSILNMLRYVKNSTALCIDNWDMDRKEIDMINSVCEHKNYSMDGVEKIFLENIKISGMEARINYIKGQSADVLLVLLKNEYMFDFIYVDGSHNCFDVYADMVVAWKLLNPGGIMGVDDYLWMYDKNNDENILDIPYKAINHFCSVYENDLDLLYSGYRVYIQKK